MVFTPPGTKYEAEQAYDSLQDILYHGNYEENIIRLETGMCSPQNTLDETVVRDFTARREAYKYCFVTCAPGLLQSLELPECLISICDQVERFQESVDDALVTPDMQKIGIKNSIDRCISAKLLKLLKVLKEIPDDEVNKDNRGIRIKSLKDAGYTTIADIYTVSE